MVSAAQYLLQHPWLRQAGLALAHGAAILGGVAIAERPGRMAW